MSKKSALIRMLEYRMHAQRMTNCILLWGAKGKGKSWLAMRLGELLDKDFNLSRIVFDPKDLFALLQSNLKPGSVVVLDEAGVAANSRDFATKTNKSMNFISQVIRPAAITVIFIAPSLGLVDVAVRNLMDFVAEAQGFDKRTGISRFKFMAISPRIKADPLRKHLVFAENGVPVKYTSWSCRQPSPALADAYVAKRKAFMLQQISDAGATLETGESIRFGKGKPKKERTKLTDVAEQIIKDEAQFMDGKRFLSALIQERFGIGRCACQNVVKLVKVMQKRKKVSLKALNTTLANSMKSEQNSTTIQVNNEQAGGIET